MTLFTFFDKKIFFSLLILGVSLADPVLASCPSSGLTASTGATTINGGCAVVGNITLSGSATLTMSNGNLFVSGNIVLNDNASLSVTTGTLTFPQSNFSQYSIKLYGASQFTVIDSSFVTNFAKQNNFAMSLNANDNSVVRFKNANLNTTSSWLLGNFHNNSKLIVINTKNLPTEMYPFDASKISVSSSSFAGLWLNFASGDKGIVNVPKLDTNGKFNFIFTPSQGNIYSVNIATGSGRIGLNSHPNSTLTVNGNTSSLMNYVNVIFGYYVENSTAPVVIDGLTVGGFVTKKFTDQGRNLTLNNVYINPLAWQLYVSQSNGFPVTIKNSTINELAAFTNGIVNISDSTLQLAVSGAVGPGSKLTITNTDVWSSTILAIYGGKMNISNSHVHGNFISASRAGSSIVMTNVTESRNGIPPQSCAPVDGYPPNNNGVPLCNPFNPLYQCSQVTATAGATITASPALTCPAKSYK
jgi:hypothetical protein